MGIAGEERSAADTRQRRSALGLWEYGRPGAPQMKTHPPKQSALNIPSAGPPDEIMERPDFHPRHIITIGHMERGHRSPDNTGRRGRSCHQRGPIDGSSSLLFSHPWLQFREISVTDMTGSRVTVWKVPSCQLSVLNGGLFILRLTKEDC